MEEISVKWTGHWKVVLLGNPVGLYNSELQVPDETFSISRYSIYCLLLRMKLYSNVN